MKVLVSDLKPGMVVNGGRVVEWAVPAADGSGWGVKIDGQPYCRHSRYTVFDILGPVP